jgi:cyclophilin family peptidyl-prolyl cis-trans isomerase
VEGLEDRCLLAAPVIDPIANQQVPASKTLIVPVTATDTDGNPLTYTASSSDATFQVQVKTGNPFLKISVANFGDMVFELFQDLAPKTVGIFSGLVKSEFYNGLTFHRVVNNFVIQGGDPKGDGTGGPGFQFDDEFNASAIFSGTGQLAMANSGKDTNGSQFFITDGTQRALDFNHTIFGQLIRGFDVLKRIEAVPVDPTTSKPLTPVVITSASIIQNSTDTVLVITAPPGTPTSTISVTANDGKGGTDTKTFQASAVADTTNDPPILGTVTDHVTPVNTPVTFTVPSTDPENDLNDFDVVDPSSTANPLSPVPLQNATVNVTQLSNNSASVTITPNAGFTGAIHALVRVRDHGATNRGSTSGNPFDTQQITIGVGAAALTASALNTSGSEGTALNNVGVASFTSSNASAAASDFTASINWGDGHVTTGTVTAASASTFLVSGTNTYKEAGKFPVAVSIQGPLGATAMASSTATIIDAVLSTQGVAVSASVGVALNNVSVATFTDADPMGQVSDYTATINWGDNQFSTGTISASSGNVFTVAGNHTYAAQGSFTVSATINDINTAGDVTGSTATSSSTATVTVPNATTTALTAAPNPSVFGQSITFTATVSVTAPGTGTPTGTVNFLEGTTTLGTGTLDANGRATFTTTTLGAGTHSITASYPGVVGSGTTPGFGPSTSPAVTQTVNVASTTTTLTSSPNPVDARQSVTFTATVSTTAAGGGTPTGTVNFQEGSTTLGSGTLNASGVATFTTSTLSAGSHTIMAVYAGTSNFTTSTSAAITQTVNVVVATNQQFLNRLFHDNLGRDIDPAGSAYISPLLDSGQVNRFQVGLAVTTSLEGRIVQVTSLYQTFLRRQPDPQGMSNSVQFLQLGGSLVQLRAVLLASPEYFQTHGGSSVGFVTSLYQDVLGHGPNATALARVGAAQENVLNRLHLALAILNTPESLRRIVDNLFTIYLHRTADPVALVTFTQSLSQGAPEELVAMSLIGSDEYFNRK